MVLARYAKNSRGIISAAPRLSPPPAGTAHWFQYKWQGQEIRAPLQPSPPSASAVKALEISAFQQLPSGVRP